LKIIFLGPPGAGKGVNAKAVVEKYQIPHISTGNILRDAVKTGNELGKKVKETIEKGELVTDEIMNELIKEDVLDLHENFLLDGYPRTIPQAEFLDEELKKMNKKMDAVILFEIDEEEIVKRLTSRIVCPNCQTIYNSLTSKPKKENICDNCGSELSNRADDKEEKIIRDRFRIYKENTSPLIEYYSKNNILFTINSNRELAEVTKKMFNILQGVSSNDNS
jgi:adenylate kinase